MAIKRSFTLIEMVVAMAVMVVVAMIIGTASATFYNAYQRSQRNVDQLETCLMIDRIFDEVGDTIPVYATGGLSSIITPHCKHKVTYDEHLVLKGLNIIYKKNQ